MLIRAMFLAVFVATIAQAALYAAGASAKAALHQRAVAAARAQTARGIALAQNAVAASMKTDAPIVLPSPTPACAVRIGAACAFEATITLAAVPAVPNAMQSCPAIECAIYLQNNDAVREDRTAVRVSVAIGTPGDVLARRETTVAFRTLRVPPYALPVGANDTTLDTLTKTGTGDDGGAASAGAGTLVNVVYSNGATITPANVWGSRNENPQASVPSWDR